MPSRDPDPDQPKSLFAEIRRRRVFRVAGAYVLVAWVLMQAGEIVFPAFELPNSALRFLILSLVAGLPCVVLLAWAVDVTPTGIRLTRRIRARGNVEEGGARETLSATGRSLEMVLLGVCIPVFAFSMLLLFFALRGPEDAGPHEGEAQASDVRSLAVLPFEDLSTGADDDGFFARGMHEDILTHLARLSPLKLISRTSVMAYAGGTKNIREIGRELGVDHILEGSVRRTPTNVRVTLQLIRTETDEHVWAENYDSGLEDVFAVQTRIAKAVASALEAELVPSAVVGTARSSAVVPAAYDAYLKARDIHRNLDAEDRAELARARHLYETALQYDASLASAWLQLGILHSQAHWFGFDRSPERMDLARDSLERARGLGVDAGQLALAEGILAYYVEADFGKALLHFSDAAERAPGNVEAFFYRAMILRRSGELEKALTAQEAALDLDPLNLGYRDEYALTLAMAGRLVEARDELQDILRSDPSRLRARVQKWQLDLELDGQPLELLEEILASPRDRWLDQHYSMLDTVAVLAGRPEMAITIVARRPVPKPDSGYLDYQRAVLEGFAAHPERKKALLARSHEKLRTFLVERPDAMRDVDRRRVEAMFAYQAGDLEEAIRLQAANVLADPIERDLIAGSSPLWSLIQIQLVARQFEDAIESIERLRSHVALGSVLYGGHFVLAHWPEFEAARENPRFASFMAQINPGYEERSEE